MFIYGTYVLEGEADAKFSLSDIWNLFQEDTLPSNASNFWREMINYMEAWNYLQKTLDLPLNNEIIRQAHGLMVGCWLGVDTKMSIGTYPQIKL